MGPILGSFCPNILFPFARESISAMVAKGGFPDFQLQPINFEALYLQGQQEQEAQAAAGDGDATPADATPAGNGGTH